MPGKQAVILYENLACDRAYHLFDDMDGAGSHCQLGDAMQGNMVRMDRSEEKLPIDDDGY